MICLVPLKTVSKFSLAHIFDLPEDKYRNINLHSESEGLKSSPSFLGKKKFRIKQFMLNSGIEEK